MKIAVCVKQVPDSETRINLSGPVPELDRSSFTMIINPYDQFAVEEAVQIKEKLGEAEITVVTVGPEAGVRETWLVDPEAHTISIYSLPTEAACFLAASAAVFTTPVRR